MKEINIVSETAFMVKGNGVHTAFVNHVELLNSRPDLKVFVNSSHTGNVMHSHTYGLYYFIKGLRYHKRKVLTAHVIPDSIKGPLFGNFTSRGRGDQRNGCKNQKCSTL